jgi:hypothetical protein
MTTPRDCTRSCLIVLSWFMLIAAAFICGAAGLGVSLGGG